MVVRPDKARVEAIFSRRIEPLDELAHNAADVARACHAMAVRFHAGGKLVVFGNGGSATDAQHVAVEFVHPVIVGKRALPAISLTSDVATVTGVAKLTGFDEIFAHQIRSLAERDDIALGLSGDGSCRNVLHGLRTARDRGLLTIALVGGDGGAIAAEQVAEHTIVTTATDARVVKEVHVTTYHVLWELVHVFFEQPGVLQPQVVAS
jgi:D-sedoheptulose 7-phosphate isomerase